MHSFLATTERVWIWIRGGYANRRVSSCDVFDDLKSQELNTRVPFSGETQFEVLVLLICFIAPKFQSWLHQLRFM